MDPKGHPDPADLRLALALRGAWASYNASLAMAHRAIAMLVMWFLALGVPPTMGYETCIVAP